MSEPSATVVGFLEQETPTSILLWVAFNLFVLIDPIFVAQCRSEDDDFNKDLRLDCIQVRPSRKVDRVRLSLLSHFVDTAARTVLSRSHGASCSSTPSLTFQNFPCSSLELIDWRCFQYNAGLSFFLCVDLQAPRHCRLRGKGYHCVNACSA